MAKTDKKKKKMTIFRNLLTKFLVNFAIIFSILSIFYITVGAIIGVGNFSSVIVWGVITLFSVLLSVIFYFLFKMNQITIFLQIVLVYVIFTIAVYTLGYILRLFTIHDIPFFIVSIVISFIGLIILSLILMFKNHRETEDLNKKLKDYKERDKK